MIIFTFFSLIIVYFLTLQLNLGKFLAIILLFTFAGGTDIAAKVIDTQIERSKIYAAKTLQLTSFKKQYKLLHTKTNKGTKWVNTGANDATITSSNSTCILRFSQGVTKQYFVSIQCLNKELDLLTNLPISFDAGRTKHLFTDIRFFKHIGNTLQIHPIKETKLKIMNIFKYTFSDFQSDIESKNTLYINNKIQFSLNNSQQAIQNISLL